MDDDTRIGVWHCIFDCFLCVDILGGAVMFRKVNLGKVLVRGLVSLFVASIVFDVVVVLNVFLSGGL